MKIKLFEDFDESLIGELNMNFDEMKEEDLDNFSKIMIRIENLAAIFLDEKHGVDVENFHVHWGDFNLVEFANKDYIEVDVTTESDYYKIKIPKQLIYYPKDIYHYNDSKRFNL